MMLYECSEGNSYRIIDVMTEDEDIRTFLFSLGCYEGEDITVISKKKRNMIIAVKDGRYSIDKELAELIKVA